MSVQLTLIDDEPFDARLSKALKERGMALAAGNNYDLLAVARIIALTHDKASIGITADDVGRALKDLGKPHCLGPAAGSLFKEKHWVFTGEWRPSKRTTNHGRMLRVWRYVPHQAGP